MLQVPEPGLSSVVDQPTSQNVGEAVIRLQEKNWRMFLTTFGGNEKTLRKRVD